MPEDCCTSIMMLPVASRRPRLSALRDSIVTNMPCMEFAPVCIHRPLPPVMKGGAILRTGNFFRIHSRFPVRSNRKPHGQVKFMPVHSIVRSATQISEHKIELLQVHLEIEVSNMLQYRRKGEQI